MADEQMQRHSLADAEFLRRLAGAQGFSDNPRWKRHASLDAGVFRSRMTSILPYSDNDSPVSYADSPEEEKRFLNDFPTTRSSIFAHSNHSPGAFSLKPRKRRRGLCVGLSGGVALLLLLLVWASRSKRPLERQLWAAKDMLEEYGVMLPFLHPACDNPYNEYGHLTVDQHDPEKNRWLPYDPTCTTPELMAALRSTAPDKAPKLLLPTPPKSNAPSSELPLPWLYGKTVLLFGDHVERYHSKDVCNFAGGAFETIDGDHPLSPPRFLNGIDEKFVSPSKAARTSRPTVCYLEQYDFMIVTVFHFGLANRIEFEHEHLLQDENFYPPVAVQDRLSHIVKPLLKSLNRTEPNLVEFSSGFWDLRHFTALDEQVGADPFGELTTDRLQWYSDRLSQSLLDVGAMFPGVPLLWRSLHQPPRDQSTPFSRVAALDQLGRKIVANLNLSRRRRGGKHPILPPLVSKRPNPKITADERESTHAPFLNRVKQRIGASEPSGEAGATGAGEHDDQSHGPIRIDEWGALMLGQEHLMNGMHTPALPGGYIWGDIMLFELRRSALHTASE